jgi:hypothetical protein
MPGERARFERALEGIGDVTGYVYEYEELIPGGKEE